METVQKSIRKQRRRLDHLADIQDGEPFTMIPQRLLRAWIEKKIPDAKFRLLCCMLSNNEYFQLRRNYLDNRFDWKTLKKYLPELEAEGYIEVERVARDKGGYENIYHVRSLHEWAIMQDDPDPGRGRYRPDRDPPGDDLEDDTEDMADHIDDPGLGGDRLGDPGLGGDRSGRELKNINLKETKRNETKGSVCEEEKQHTPKNEYEEKAQKFTKKLREDFDIVSDPKLMTHALSLIANNLSRPLDWVEEKYPEWSLYLASSRPHLRDVSNALYKWAQHWRDPQKTWRQSSKSQPQEKYYTDEYITSEEDLDRILGNG